MKVAFSIWHLVKLDLRGRETKEPNAKCQMLSAFSPIT
jgi:hypothetical protein